MTDDPHAETVIHYDILAHDAENSIDELLRAANGENRQFAMMQIGSMSRIKTKLEIALSALTGREIR